MWFKRLTIVRDLLTKFITSLVTKTVPDYRDSPETSLYQRNDVILYRMVDCDRMHSGIAKISPDRSSISERYFSANLSSESFGAAFYSVK
ncbi:MAG: hypothetical protein D6728_14230 [Cyanobacteria bacterium J055]|nr:MAG: hypothetical protein D6728_14230 [Cyanobacteria bacterium J055]